jgi:hypothetical protein
LFSIYNAYALYMLQDAKASCNFIEIQWIAIPLKKSLNEYKS